LERRFRFLGIANLTLYLVFGQGLFFVLGMAQPGQYTSGGQLVRPGFLDKVVLNPAAVMNGEIWRLATFIFVPPTMSLIFILFALYLFYIMGTALERQWGEFRYTIYLLIAYLATVGGAFAAWGLGSAADGTSSYIAGSVFLAFAFLYPDFELLL